MRYAYYPGCSLEGTANDYGRSVIYAFKIIGIDLIELPDWTCCGSTAAHSLSELMTVLLPSKNIAIAEEMGLELVAPCPMCFNRLIYAQDRIKKRLKDSPWPLSGELPIHDPTRLLSEESLLRVIAEAVKRPLKGLRVVCYYGCQMVRPPKLTGFKEFQNPTTMDKIVQALGAEVIDWSYKTICCGASIKIGRKDIGLSLSFRLIEKAIEFGAEAIVVSCPLCQFNLDSAQFETKRHLIPIFYFTELMLLAFAHPNMYPDTKAHLVDPVPLLTQKSLSVK